MQIDNWQVPMEWRKKASDVSKSVFDKAGWKAPRLSLATKLSQNATNFNATKLLHKNVFQLLWFINHDF